MLLAMIGGLRDYNAAQFSSICFANLPEYPFADLLALREIMRINAEKGALMTQQADVAQFYSDPLLMLRHLRAYFLHSVMRRILSNIPVFPINQVQRLYVEAINEYLTTNRLWIFQINNFTIYPNLIEPFFAKVRDKLLEYPEYQFFVNELCQGLN